MKTSITLLVLCCACCVANVAAQSSMSSIHSKSEFECYPVGGVTEIRAGYRVECTVVLYKNPATKTGDYVDTCYLRLVRCLSAYNNTDATETQTNMTSTLNNATFIEEGSFTFHFNPVIAGTYSLSVIAYETAVSVKSGSSSTLTVKPSTVVDQRNSETSCTVNHASGLHECTVLHRDQFSNVVQQCTTSYTNPQDGDVVSSQCTVL